MKPKCNVSLVQFAPQWCEREANAERMASVARQESERGADMIVFPELVNIGYNPVPPEPPTLAPESEAMQKAARYVASAEPIPGPTTELLTRITRSYGNYIIVGIAQSHPEVPHTLFNAAVLLGPTGVIGVHHKTHPALQEKMFFYPGQTLDVYDTNIGKVGMLVCYDARFPEAARALTLKGAEIIVSIWASRHLGNFCPPEHFKHTAFTRAMENCNYFLACNRVGREGENVYSGHSAIGGPNGSIVAASDTDQEEVVRATLEHEQVLRARAVFPYFRDRRPDLYSKLTEPWLSPQAAEHPPKVSPQASGPLPSISQAPSL
ncbi:MAG: carbon-nitrogen hydrolase family protein [Chloroflexi bacterium]|nr:carbon-nitrogen hydrolase family protein [Chloroflexota bacterium]